METTDDTNHWYTVPEACKYLRVSRATLYASMADGRLRFYQLKGARARRFKKSDLDALLEPGNPSDPAESDE